MKRIQSLVCFYLPFASRWTLCEKRKNKLNIKKLIGKIPMVVQQNADGGKEKNKKRKLKVIKINGLAKNSRASWKKKWLTE